MQINFLVVSSIVPQILVAGMVHLLAATVLNLVGLVVCQLLFQFVVDISVLPYDAIMM